jgi:hypothetical protein
VLTRVFRDFRYCTIDSWSRTRRVVGKAEYTLEGANPRFIVTSLKRSRVGYDARALYEKLYCARGEAENCESASDFDPSWIFAQLIDDIGNSSVRIDARSASGLDPARRLSCY